MSLDKIPEPVSKRLIKSERFVGNNTICQTIRNTYFICKQQSVRNQLRLIMAMAKSMDDRLVEYKKIFDKFNEMVVAVRHGTGRSD